MTWLSGKPKKIISLRWPLGDPRLEALQRHFDPLAYSVLDDQILRLVVEKEEGPSSHIYLARIYEAIANNQEQVTFTVCAVLPYVVHRAALLPNKAGFVSLTFVEESSTITLRIHNWDGSVVKETSTHAAAAYNRLVVQGNLIGICISSGEESDVELELDGFPPATCRVDYSGYDHTRTEYDAPFGDEIVVWNWRTGLLDHVKIPQDPNAPMRHEGNFQFVDEAFVALGGTLSSAFGNPSALLKTFSLSGDYTRTFSHDPNFEMDHDLDVVAQSSSSKPNDILVNYHHSGGRITVVKNDLLKDGVESQPDSTDPSGLHRFLFKKEHVRTISGTVNPYLPAVSDNRVLLDYRLDYGDVLVDFAIGSDPGNVIFLLDFDQRRCRNLLDNRNSLEEQIKADNEKAQVTVVQRNYYVSIEDDEDREYPRFQAPAEWQEHLRDIWRIQEDRKRGDMDTPILEFDEGPSEMKEKPRLVFTRSVVCLPPIEFKAMEQLTLSSCGIIYIPKPGEEGHILVFDN